MKKTLNKGFTLIELLVVIAIIGILASVILASLNSARAKGVDAATKSDLNNARAQAELYYDNGSGTSANTYLGVCAATVTTQGIYGMLLDASTKLNGSTPIVSPAGTATAGSATTLVCHDSATAWAASVPLKSITTPVTYFCVDSTGASKQNANPLAGGATVCP
jgi:prepilin-type N-terminal cleavage/methylation domain-containing protein